MKRSTLQLVHNRTHPQSPKNKAVKTIFNEEMKIRERKEKKEK